MESSIIMSPKALSAYLGVSRRTIYRLIDENRIPYQKIGGQYRFHKSEVDEWLKNGSNRLSQLADILPKFDLNVDSYDKMFLKWRTELKGLTKWKYGIGSVILRKTQNKEDRYYIHYQVNGHRIRKALKGIRSRAEAVKVLNQEVADALRGQYNFLLEKKKIGFAEMADLFLEKYSKPNKRSWKSADRVYTRNMKPFFGDIKLTKITPLMIENYKMERLENGTGRRTDEKVSNRTINAELSCLRKIFNKAIDWGYALENPVTKVDFLPERSSIRKRVLTEDEESRLIAVAPPPLKHMLIVALHTGMRKGEVLNLKWENVDFETKEITIVETKDDEDRVVPMNPILFDLLMTLKSQDGNSEYVFTNPRTRRHYVEIKRTFVSSCKKADVEDLHFHDLRHTYASRLVRNGVDLNTVKELLGHSSIITTQRYLHSQIEQKRAAVYSLAGQTYAYGLQWQTSDKVATVAVKPDGVNPFYLRS